MLHGREAARPLRDRADAQRSAARKTGCSCTSATTTPTLTGTSTRCRIGQERSHERRGQGRRCPRSGSAARRPPRRSIDLAGGREDANPRFRPADARDARRQPFSDPEWLFEMKLDGYRIEAVVEDGRSSCGRATSRTARATSPISRGQADLDQRDDRHRGRRGRGAQRGGRPRLLPAPGPDRHEGLRQQARRAPPRAADEDRRPTGERPRRTARLLRSST